MTDTETIVVVLPWPDTKKLHAHNKGRWHNKSKAVKGARQTAWAEARKHTRPLMPWDPATLSLAFYMPDALSRDTLNLVQTCKPYVDGVVDAGLIADDNWKVLSIGGVTCEVDRERPRVELRLTHGKPVYPAEGGE